MPDLDLHDPTRQVGRPRDRSPGSNIIVLPDPRHGRLAELLAAARGPAQSYELRSEPAVRALFDAVAHERTPRRNRGRLPLTAALASVVSLLLASTGLAAASDLPQPAQTALDGLLGSVGVHATAVPAPVTAAIVVRPPGTAASGRVVHSAGAVAPCERIHSLHPTARVRAICIDAPSPHGIGASAATASPGRETAKPAPKTSTPARSRHVGGRRPNAGGTGVAPTGGTTPGGGTDPGGGTSRGGNVGAGGGSSCPGSDTPSDTVDHGGSTTGVPTDGTATTAADPASDPAATDPATDPAADPTSTDRGCHGGAHAGRHHRRSGSSDDPVPPSTAPLPAASTSGPRS